MIHENDDIKIDFSWIVFVGHCLLGFTVKEVGRMTLRRFTKLYEYYKNRYDFTLSKMTYRELEEKTNHRGEMFSD